jgi:hypothetical protein
MPGDGSQRGGSPFIFRKLRPKLKSDEPAPPLLPAAPPPADLKRHVSEILGEGLGERLGMSDSGRLKQAPGQVLSPMPSGLVPDSMARACSSIYALPIRAVSTALAR